MCSRAGLAIGLALVVLSLPSAARTELRLQRTSPSPELLDLLARAGEAFSAKRFAAAARLYRQAWASNPRNAQPLVMAGVAAYQSQATGRARSDLRQALRSELSPEDRELALTYLGLIADELPASTEPAEPDAAPGWSLSLATSVGGGYDSNARQARRGVLDAEDPSADATGSLFASAGVELGCDFHLDQKTEVELGLGFEQSLYPDRAREALDFQEHALALAVAHRLRPELRLRLLASSDLSFSGAGTALRPFQTSFRLEPQVVIGAGLARLRVSGAWQATSTHDPELAHLTGRRLEVTFTPIVSIDGWVASLAGRVRHNRLGTQWTDLAPVEDPLCADCGSATAVSHSHDSLGGTLLISSPYGWSVRPQIWGRWDLRIYDQDRSGKDHGLWALERHDTRLRRDENLALGASVAVRLGRQTSVNLRYERSGFSSTLTPADIAQGCSAEACAVPERRGFGKQVLQVDLTIDWL